MLKYAGRAQERQVSCKRKEMTSKERTHLTQNHGILVFWARTLTW